MFLSSPHGFGKPGIDTEQQHYKHPPYQEEGFQPSPLESTKRGLHMHTSTLAAVGGIAAPAEPAGCGRFKGQAQELQYT